MLPLLRICLSTYLNRSDLKWEQSPRPRRENWGFRSSDQSLVQDLRRPRLGWEGVLKNRWHQHRSSFNQSSLFLGVGEKTVKLMIPTPKVPTVGANWQGITSTMYMDERLRIGGRGAPDEFDGYQTSKANLIILLRQS
jgi:hypothetical protein